MGFKEKLLSTTTARESSATFSLDGEDFSVLFIEPSMADHNRAQRENMKYKMHVDEKGKNTVEVDSDKSDMANYNGM